jgi:hypothetical protein
VITPGGLAPRRGGLPPPGSRIGLREAAGERDRVLYTIAAKKVSRWWDRPWPWHGLTIPPGAWPDHIARRDTRVMALQPALGGEGAAVAVDSSARRITRQHLGEKAG